MVHICEKLKKCHWKKANEIVSLNRSFLTVQIPRNILYSALRHKLYLQINFESKLYYLVTLTELNFWEPHISSKRSNDTNLMKIKYFIYKSI